MAVGKGRNILIKISDGASPGTFSTVAGIRTRTITINNEQVDITDSDSAPWRHLLGDAGLRTMSISGAGVFQDDAAYNSIQNEAINGSLQEYQVVFENGDIFQGLFQVASLEEAGEHVGEQTYSLTLESAGQIALSRA